MGRKLTTYPPEVTRFWENYRKLSRLPEGTPWEAWPFGDNPRLADELLKLVLEGGKRGTADLLLEYEHRGEAVPEVGDHSVILDGRGATRRHNQDITCRGQAILRGDRRVRVLRGGG